MTGERELRADAMLEYFEPLITWLKTERQKVKCPIGWSNTKGFTGKERDKTTTKESDKPIFIKNSSDVELSYVRAIKKETTLQKTKNLNQSNAGPFKDTNASSSYTLKEKINTTKLKQYRLSNSVNVLEPLGQTKSSILTRPVFVPFVGNNPLTLAKTNDRNRISKAP